MTGYTDAEALAERIRDDLYDELEHGVGVISHGDLYQVDDAVDDELILVGEDSGRRFRVTVHVDVCELNPEQTSSPPVTTTPGGEEAP